MAKRKNETTEAQENIAPGVSTQVTKAQELLARFPDVPRVEMRAIDGQDYALLRFSFVDLMALAARSTQAVSTQPGADTKSVDVKSLVHHRLAELLHAGIVQSPDDLTPRHTAEEWGALIECPGAMEMVRALVDAIGEVNPNAVRAVWGGGGA